MIDIMINVLYADTKTQHSLATALGGDRVDSPTLGRLYARRRSPVLIFRRLNGPQDQSGHEGLKKNLEPSDTQNRTRAVQACSQAPCHLSYLAHNIYTHN